MSGPEPKYPYRHALLHIKFADEPIAGPFLFEVMSLRRRTAAPDEILTASRPFATL